MLESAVPQDEQSEFTFSEVSAGSLILEYVRSRVLDTSIKLQPPVRRSPDEYMVIDKQSLRGLEIRQTLKDGLTQGSLLHTIRRTVTKSGARLLSQRLVSPSLSLTTIDSRLDLVQELRYRDALREHVQALLRKTSDTCRLLQRFSIGKGDADDMLGLAKTIAVMQQMTELLHDHILSIEASDIPLLETEQKTSGPLLELTCFWNMLERFDLIGPMQAANSILSTIDEEGLSRKHQAEVEESAESEQMAQDIESADASGADPPKLARRASKQAATASAIGNGEQDIWIMRKQASLSSGAPSSVTSAI
jgi:DNA mismatch repair ATPase MutS